jgi:hypothetical protein
MTSGFNIATSTYHRCLGLRPNGLSVRSHSQFWPGATHIGGHLAPIHLTNDEKGQCLRHLQPPPKPEVKNARAAAGCEVFRPSRAGASKLPGASLMLRAWPLPQTEGWKTGDGSNPGCRLRRRPRGISVLLDFFNPLGLGNSFPSHSPSSDASFLANPHRKCGDLRHRS